MSAFGGRAASVYSDNYDLYTGNANPELARKIASKSPRALRLAKWSLNGIELLDVKKSYRFEQGFTLELYTSPDSQEARDAFVEKRGAKFEKD